MTLLLSNDEVDRLLDMGECLEVFEGAYRELGEGVGVSRTGSQIFTPTRHSPDALYLFKSMDGVAPFLDVAATRLCSEILTWPKDSAGRAKKARIGAAPNGRFVGLVLLFSTTTGEPLAIFPDGIIQRMRVGATTGLGAKYLARPDAREVAMLGCGWQAAAQVMAITAVRRIERVRCFSPNAERRDGFARAMAERTGISVVGCATPREAVRGADVVLCATNAWSPVLFPDWIEKGMHLGTIQYAEWPLDLIKAVDELVSHNPGRPGTVDASRGIDHAEKAEDIRRAVRSTIREHELPNLPDLVLGRTKGRTSPGEVTAFLNYAGLGYQFAALGALVHRNAREQGVGRELPTDWFTEDVNP